MNQVPGFKIGILDDRLGAEKIEDYLYTILFGEETERLLRAG